MYIEVSAEGDAPLGTTSLQFAVGDQASPSAPINVVPA
jgi:hypothetical protein